jgi:hypothetical protein
MVQEDISLGRMNTQVCVCESALHKFSESFRLVNRATGMSESDSHSGAGNQPESFRDQTVKNTQKNKVSIIPYHDGSTQSLTQLYRFKFCCLSWVFSPSFTDYWPCTGPAVPKIDAHVVTAEPRQAMSRVTHATPPLQQQHWQQKALVSVRARIAFHVPT